MVSAAAMFRQFAGYVCLWLSLLDIQAPFAVEKRAFLLPPDFCFQLGFCDNSQAAIVCVNCVSASLHWLHCRLLAWESSPRP